MEDSDRERTGQVPLEDTPSGRRAHAAGVEINAAEVAWSDTDALVVTYDCSPEQMQEGFDTVQFGQPLPEALRTFVHEHVHLDHTLTTPFGLFLHRLRRLQSSATYDLLRVLREELALKVRLPLIRYVRTLRPDIQKRVDANIKAWYAAEIFRTEQAGSLRAMDAIARTDPMYAEVVSEQGFRNLQALVWRLEQSSASDKYSAGLPSDLLNEPSHDDPSFEQIYGLYISLRETVEMSFAAVLESAARAAELVGDAEADIQAMFLRGHKPGLIADLPYVGLLDITEEALAQLPPRTRLFTHIAACELALFAPILPEHRALRAGLHWLELNPLIRYHEIWGVLRDMPPVTEAAEAPFFQENVCRALGWVAPSQIIAADVDRSRLGVREQLYHISLSLRNRQPGVFCDPWTRVFKVGSTVGDAVREAFTYPIIQHPDRMLFLKDKELLATFELDHLWHQWMRHLMTRHSSPMKMPWRSSEEEREYLSGLLRDQLTRLLGRSAPRPVLLSGD
jgi:hypothetical protein